MGTAHRGSIATIITAGCVLALVACGGRTGVPGNPPDPDPLPGCPNGILEPHLGESCDSDNLGGWSCQSLGFTGGTLSCSASCDFDTSLCTEEETCGNGDVDLGESCDGDNLNGHSCLSLGWAGGTLSCDEQCVFNTDYCLALEGCGDGEVDVGEECDDANRAPCDGCSEHCNLEVCGNGVVDCNEGCDDGNVESGDGCSAGCQPETNCGDGVCDAAGGETCTNCAQDCCPDCGNGVVNPGEECDGTNFDGQTCESLCFSAGQLACNADCTLDTSQCTGAASCGNGIAECDEQCDQTDLQNRSCRDFGFEDGALSCSNSCTFDTSQCTGFLWYFREDFEDPSSTGQWALTGDWEVGSPTGAAGEPATAYEGAQCLGTGMGVHYGNARTWMGNLAVTPAIDLSFAQAPVLQFAMWLDTEACCDGGSVWIRPTGSANWTHLDNPSVSYSRPLDNQFAWSGEDFAAWQLVEFDLGSWAGTNVQLGFSLYSDGSVTAPGFYVDEVLVTEASAAPVTILTDPELGAAPVGQSWSTLLQAAGGSGLYEWTKQPGGSNDGWLTVNPVTGELSGVPGAGNRGPVQVVIRAADVTQPVNYDEVTFELSVVDAIWTETFDSGSGSWTLNGDWEWGTPFGSGPPSCRANSCLGTAMGGDYSANQTWALNTATSPPLNLANTTTPMLQFWAYVDSEGSTFDGGNLKISTGGPSFTVVTDVTPAYNLNNVGGQWAWGGPSWTSGWVLFQVDLTPWAGQSILLQFGFRSDPAVERAGFYVDELVILD